MQHPAQDRVKLAFEDLADRMEVAADVYEVQNIVGKGRRVVVESRGAAKKLARKLQHNLAKFGAEKQKSLRVREKSTKASAGLGPVHGSVEHSETTAPAPES